MGLNPTPRLNRPSMAYPSIFSPPPSSTTGSNSGAEAQLYKVLAGWTSELQSRHSELLVDLKDQLDRHADPNVSTATEKVIRNAKRAFDKCEEDLAPSPPAKRLAIGGQGNLISRFTTLPPLPDRSTISPLPPSPTSEPGRLSTRLRSRPFRQPLFSDEYDGQIGQVEYPRAGDETDSHANFQQAEDSDDELALRDDDSSYPQFEDDYAPPPDSSTQLSIGSSDSPGLVSVQDVEGHDSRSSAATAAASRPRKGPTASEKRRIAITKALEYLFAALEKFYRKHKSMAADPQGWTKINRAMQQVLVYLKEARREVEQEVIGPSQWTKNTGKKVVGAYIVFRDIIDEEDMEDWQEQWPNLGLPTPLVEFEMRLRSTLRAIRKLKSTRGHWMWKGGPLH